MTLKNKILLAQNIIREAYLENNGMIFLSFSGGKDSTILRHIVLQLYPDVPVVFSNTTNELIEVLKYVKTFENVIHVRPKMSFTEVVKKYGFPAVSKEVAQKVNELKHTNGIKTRTTRLQGDEKGNGILPSKWRFLAEEEFDVTHKCCKILKKDPLEKWAKENGRKPIIALMADESALRKQLSLYGKDNGKIYPFLTTDWTESDIWEYAALYNIRFAECYYDQNVDGVILKARSRTGCEYCMFGSHLESVDRFERSKLSTPKRFEKMMMLENNGVKFSTVLSIIKQNTHKPILDLYGVKILGSIINDIAKNFFIENRNATKTCPDCNSRNIVKKDSYKQSFFDAPENGMARKIWIVKDSFECKSCGSNFIPKTPMVNDEFCATDRLISFIDNVKDIYSFEKLISETHLNKPLAIKILTHILLHKNI